VAGDDPMDSPGVSQREQTDESLRVERDKADARIANRKSASEDEADRVVKVARQLADHVVQDARDHADLTQPSSAATEAGVERERVRADVSLEDKRSDEDAALKEERVERARYLADFLAVEREATDEDISREREYADRLVSTRDDFLANVSHDIRSLLGGLGMNSGLLLKYVPEGPAGDPMRKYVAANQRLAARMNRLINDLLDVARIDAGKISLLTEEVEVNKIFRDTLEAFGPMASAKEIKLEADALAKPFHAHMDAGRVLQVLANLVSNAIKFTPAGGRVSIGVRAEKGEIVFSVTDTGIGIPSAELQGIFERFRQISKDRRGLGLGLHISKSIVEAHGGRMSVESEPGSGSAFYFALPHSPSASTTSTDRTTAGTL
jgi:signal transduction histidine kinase